jgi:methionyl-tRNA synthetase
LTDLDKSILETLRKTPVIAGEYFEHYRFRDGLLEIMNLARAANKYFNDSEPWKTAKSNNTQCATTINICLQIARALAILMAPIIPGSAAKLWKMLNLQGQVEKQSWDSARELPLPAGHRIEKAEILFTKIEDSVIELELAKLGVGRPSVVDNKSKTEPKPPVTIDDFQKLDLRIAKVVECERVPKSDKLLKLQIEVGTEKRQILAGIAQHYAPEALIGKSVVVVFNLQPAKLMGLESQGMLLAASDSDGKLVFIAPSGEIASGSAVS